MRLCLLVWLWGVGMCSSPPIWKEREDFFGLNLNIVREAPFFFAVPPPPPADLQRSPPPKNNYSEERCTKKIVILLFAGLSLFGQKTDWSRNIHSYLLNQKECLLFWAPDYAAATSLGIPNSLKVIVPQLHHLNHWLQNTQQTNNPEEIGKLKNDVKIAEKTEKNIQKNHVKKTKKKHQKNNSKIAEHIERNEQKNDAKRNLENNEQKNYAKIAEKIEKNKNAEKIQTNEDKNVTIILEGHSLGGVILLALLGLELTRETFDSSEIVVMENFRNILRAENTTVRTLALKASPIAGYDIRHFTLNFPVSARDGILSVFFELAWKDHPSLDQCFLYKLLTSLSPACLGDTSVGPPFSYLGISGEENDDLIFSVENEVSSIFSAQNVVDNRFLESKNKTPKNSFQILPIDSILPVTHYRRDISEWFELIPTGDFVGEVSDSSFSSKIPHTYFSQFFAIHVPRSLQKKEEEKTNLENIAENSQISKNLTQVLFDKIENKFIFVAVGDTVVPPEIASGGLLKGDLISPLFPPLFSPPSNSLFDMFAVLSEISIGEGVYEVPLSPPNLCPVGGGVQARFKTFLQTQNFRLFYCDFEAGPTDLLFPITHPQDTLQFPKFIQTCANSYQTNHAQKNRRNNSHISKKNNWEKKNSEKNNSEQNNSEKINNSQNTEKALCHQYEQTLTRLKLWLNVESLLNISPHSKIIGSTIPSASRAVNTVRLHSRKPMGSTPGSGLEITENIQKIPENSQNITQKMNPENNQNLSEKKTENIQNITQKIPENIQNITQKIPESNRKIENNRFPEWIHENPQIGVIHKAYHVLASINTLIKDGPEKFGPIRIYS